MGCVLNEMIATREASGWRFVSRLADGVVLEARLFGPPALIERVRPRSISFLPMAYLVAARQGHSLDVNCQVSDAEWNTFFYAFVPLAKDFYGLPSVAVRRSGPVMPYVPSGTVASQSALLFSGGVDSFYSLLSLQRERRNPSYLLNINAGAYSDRREWIAAFGNLDQIATKLGVPLLYMDTNFHELFPKPHLSCHTLRNISAASLISGIASTLFYSSAETFSATNYAEAKSSRVFSIAEPLFLNALYRQDITTVVFGSDVGRIRRTEEIKDNPVVQAHLDVCTSTTYQSNRGAGPLNCGQCVKCTRTMFTLEAFGALDTFTACFPVAQFRARRRELLDRLTASDLLLDREVVTFLANRATGD